MNFNNTSYQNTFKQKIHWSHHPEQRELDRALLAQFGFAFEKTERTSFSRLVLGCNLHPDYVISPELREG